MSEPLVVVDADVLGRHRTGDETYVLNLLRSLARIAPEAGLRIAAVTLAGGALLLVALPVLLDALPVAACTAGSSDR